MARGQEAKPPGNCRCCRWEGPALWPFRTESGLPAPQVLTAAKEDPPAQSPIKTRGGDSRVPPPHPHTSMHTPAVVLRARARARGTHSHAHTRAEVPHTGSPCRNLVGSAGRLGHPPHLRGFLGNLPDAFSAWVPEPPGEAWPLPPSAAFPGEDLSGPRGRSWEGFGRSTGGPPQTARTEPALTPKHRSTLCGPRPHWISASASHGSKGLRLGSWPVADSAVAPGLWAGGPEEGLLCMSP